MARRRKIGIHYRYNENWIGGTYYIENLVSALNMLADAKKPELLIFTTNVKHFEILASKVSYPYFSYADYVRKLSLYERIVNRFTNIFLKRSVYLPSYNNVDVVFPAHSEEKFLYSQNFLYWIPDFQEHFLPHFFSEEEVKERIAYQKNILKKAKYIVLSSQACKADLNSIYPDNKLMQFVLPFAVTNRVNADGTEVLKKYGVNQHYFICCNQFWTHKNHKIVLEALHVLRAKNVFPLVIFTGKEHDPRNPGYYEELQEIIKRYALQEQVRFLGFIDRADQLTLIQKSIAVIQPSLFEGWSTVVEDAKSLNKHVVASDISVHREQLSANVDFFDPQNAEQLADTLQRLTMNEPSPTTLNYQMAIKAFAENFMNIASTIRWQKPQKHKTPSSSN